MVGISPHRRLVIILRPIISTFVLGPEIYFRKSEPFIEVFPLVLIVFVSYLASIIFYVILRGQQRGRVYDFAQCVTDTLIISSLINFTGSINSPYILLYFLNLFEGSFFLRPNGSFTIASIVTASFIAMAVVWLNHNLIPEENEFSFSIISVRYFLKVFVFSLFFYLATALMTYFRERFVARSKILEEVQMTTDDILENINSGIITIGRNGTIKHSNPAVGSILSLKDKKINGKNFRDVFLSGLKELAELIENYPRDEKQQTRLEIYNSDNTRVPLMVTLSPIRKGDIDSGGILINIVDLSAEERMQKKLRSADRMKTALELSAGIAHEIRNPLASIQGALEVITRETETNTRIKRLVELVLKESERLNNIIERFLQFVRIPKGARVNVNIVIILRDVLELIKNHPKYKNAITIDVKFPDNDTFVFCDPEQIKQVFLNILLNGLSAVGEEGKIDIFFTIEKGRCGISFKDTGNGIAPEDIDKIFQPFYSKTPGGSGLGLSVAHRIIEQHNGEITVNSHKGEGSTFTVWLPLTGQSIGKKS